MIAKRVPPARWRHLVDQNGAIDPALLTPVGSSSEHAFQLCACVGHPDAISDAEPVVVVRRGTAIAVVGGMPAIQIYGSPLSHVDLLTTTGFLEQNRPVLLAHWIGAIDSMELVMRLTAGSSGL